MPNAASVFADQSAEAYFGYVTPNLLETRDFFVARLGFKVRFESEWFVLLGLGGHQFGLLKPEQEGQSALFRRAYPGHGAWITFAVPDVDAVHARAVAAGIPSRCPCATSRGASGTSRWSRPMGWRWISSPIRGRWRRKTCHPGQPRGGVTGPQWGIDGASRCRMGPGSRYAWPG